jgi:hypothetical protein
MVSEQPCLPIQTVGLRSCIGWSAWSDMRSHHTVSCFFITGGAGNHHIAPVDPHPHIRSRYKERVAVVTVLPAEFPVHSDPLSHGNPPCELHVAVASIGMIMKCKPGLLKEYFYSFPGNLLCCRIF